MSIFSISRSLAIALLALTSHAWAEEVRLSVPSGGAIVLQVPRGWHHEVQVGPVPTLSFTPTSGNSFQVLVSVLVLPGGRSAPSSREALRRTVEHGVEGAISQAVEKSLPIHTFGSGESQGFYYAATDSAPKPGEFTYLTQGALAVSSIAVAFTVLGNGNAKSGVDPTFQMLSSARKE